MEEDIKVMLALLDQRTKLIEENQEKMIAAIYGNGKPGLNAEVHDLVRRIECVEAVPLNEVIVEVNKMVDRHLKEDENKDENHSEFIKFRWALVATILTTLISIALELYLK